MSVTVMGLAWYVAGLTPAQKAVLVALADHANDDGRHVYPSVERLTIKTSCAERTVRRALADLREMGLIRVVKESTHYAPTEYKIDLPQMQVRQFRPATDAGQDLPESADRPARNAPKPSNNHQNNHHLHIAGETESEEKESEDPALEITWGMLLDFCDQDKGKAINIWKYQNHFVKVSGIPLPNIDTAYGRKQLKEKWWPSFMAVLYGFDEPVIFDGVSGFVDTAVTDMDNFKAGSVTSPKSIEGKMIGLIAANKRGGPANGNGRTNGHANGASDLSQLYANIPVGKYGM